jgi:hypothetical protein
MTSEPEPVVHHCECAACQAGTDLHLMQRHQQINLFLSRLSEPQRRWYVATLATEPPGPSESELARITGLDRKTIQRGHRELATGLMDHPPARQRRPGAGRPRAEKKIRLS